MVNPLKSKTVLFNLIIAIAGIVSIFAPSVGSLISQNQSAVLMGVGVVGIILRAVTSGKLGFGSDDTAAPLK